MTTVVHLTLKSGDRKALDAVADSIKDTCLRKGVEIKGPHSDAPTDYRVPLYRQLRGNDPPIDSWHYSVYQRRFELRGRETVAREILQWDYPDSVRIEAAMDRA